MVQIILKQDVDALGRAGELVDVKPGYARNYLIPGGFALEATEGSRRQLAEVSRQSSGNAERERTRAEEIAATLEGLSLTFKVRAGEEGRLFGSVTTADIAEKLAEQGLELDRRDVLLDEPIKELGTFRVAVNLHADVRPEVSVWIVADA